ncbi:MAG: hypothetical protein LBR74_06995 [Eubacterium sp.]|nr:hypothetical protein [Eubacterium sp.]
MDSKSPAQVITFDKKLYIVHCDLVIGEGKDITIFNTETKEKEVVSLEHNVSQIQINKDYLFATDGKNIYKYRVNGDELLLEKNANAQTVKSNSHYYIGGIFIK